MRPANTPYVPMRLILALAAVALLSAGCPEWDYAIWTPGSGHLPPTSDPGKMWYDLGFDDGFAEDDWYWQGYDDSYDTVDFGPIYYQGSTIPFIEESTYQAGYWDGVWWAYNDGYFTSYRYAFIIGFSEGYDSAFWPDYLAFLASDEHIECLDGGWSDGYNDGFSEGRVFGANDYESYLPFDWMDALLDYEDGTDLYFDEVDVGTGVYGPVYLYEYGTDPVDVIEGAAKNTAPSTERRNRIRAALERRKISSDLEAESGRDAEDGDRDPDSYFRPLISSARQALDVAPAKSLRADRYLRLDTTWLERVSAYKTLPAPKHADVRWSR
ncbi:MAG TPA: hypothetical protein HPP77_06750 [Candidatus Hydrogenedentes bacterium]|nr:hypothetical protein [Candidatus Hydrogenedentota bacterium]HIJ74762.1 hypothetical protein [Candidatus Hydrogenedentota bacterium]